ncbi:hypothetical protein ACG7TL_002064 [Trametes sanguinea]
MADSTTPLTTHINSGAVPSVTRVADKVDPDALISTSISIQANEAKSETPIPNFEPQPLTFIVDLAIQDRDDDVEHAAEEKNDSLKSELQPDSSSELYTATEMSGVQSTLIAPPSPSLSREGAGSPSPSVMFDQTELESVSMPTEITDPPCLKETHPPNATPPPDAPGETPVALAAENAPFPMNDAVYDPVAAPSDDALQTPETPRAESAPHQGPEAGPYVLDEIFEMDLSIFETYDPALYSLANIRPLDVSIPESVFPEKLLVHDPTHLTNTLGRRETLLRLDTPVTYVRIFPKPTDLDKPVDAAKNGGRVAHLYLNNSNHLGTGSHSTVYRAPMELRLDPSSPARSRVSVAVKLADPECDAHGMLWQEARMYNAFPKDFMEDTVRTVEVPKDNGPTENSEEVQIPHTPTSQSGNISPAGESQAECEETSQLADAPQHADAPRMNIVGDADAGEENVRALQPLQDSELEDATPCDVAQTQTVASETSNAVDGCASATQDDAAPPAESTTASAPAPSNAAVQRTEALPAIVPKFFGFYAPLLPNGTVFTRTHEPEDGRTCYCRVSRWPTPILLVEECGKPIQVANLAREQREQIYHFYERLHEADFVQCSSYPRNMLVQPGPLSAPREQRSMDSPSFRIIDFGRGEALSLGCRESWFSDWKSDEEYRAKRELQLL